MSVEITGQIRNFRNSKNISPKEKIELAVKGEADLFYPAIIIKLANISELSFISEKPENAFTFVVNKLELFIPTTGKINIAEEKERLSKDLEYNKGFLLSVQKKLANERFVQNAKPEILEIEKKKQADAEAKIKAIQEQLSSLK